MDPLTYSSNLVNFACLNSCTSLPEQLACQTFLLDAWHNTLICEINAVKLRFPCQEQSALRGRQREEGQRLDGIWCIPKRPGRTPVSVLRRGGSCSSSPLAKHKGFVSGFNRAGVAQHKTLRNTETARLLLLSINSFPLDKRVSAETENTGVY